MTATNEELTLLEKWKRKLCLQEWRIRLKTQLRPEEMTMSDVAGCTEWSETIKTPPTTVTAFCRSISKRRWYMSCYT